MTRLLSFMSDIARQGSEAAPPPARGLDLLLYAPCPVKLVFKDAVDRTGFSVHVPMGCTSVDPYDPLCRATDADELPAIIASIGFGDFWRRDFVARFVDAGVFEAVRPREASPLHEAAGMCDPAGAYTIYGVTPYLFVVDEARLGTTPAPRTWAELLEPRYSGRITMCGDGDDMADAALLAVYADCGLEGVARLAGQCRGLMHSSSLAKAAGSRTEAEAAVFIMPAFFACGTKQPPGVRVVWPEDGAAASPLYFLAKKSEKARLAPLLECLTEGFAAIPSAAWFAPLALPAERSPLPPGVKLKWPGWEFIRAHDVNALRDELGRVFRAAHRAAREQGREAACAS